MGRGVSCGGGQSSLGYLFGGDAEETGGNTQPPPQNPNDAAGATNDPSKDSSEPSVENSSAGTDEPSQKPTSESFSVINQNPNFSAHDSTTNNYHRPESQNCGNFITNRSSTKVHAPPGGNSSIGFLFGDDKK